MTDVITKYIGSVNERFSSSSLSGVAFFQHTLSIYLSCGGRFDFMNLPSIRSGDDEINPTSDRWATQLVGLINSEFVGIALEMGELSTAFSDGTILWVDFLDGQSGETLVVFDDSQPKGRFWDF